MGLQKPKRKPKPPQWMTVYVSHNLQEAHIISGKLRAEDIQTMVHTEPGASAIGITIGNLGEIKVLVSPDDYDRALDILEHDDYDQLEDNTDAIQYIWEDDDEE
jgi:hypothetical protein